MVNYKEHFQHGIIDARMHASSFNLGKLAYARKVEKDGYEPLVIAVDKSLPTAEKSPAEILQIGDDLKWQLRGMEVAAQKSGHSENAIYLSMAIMILKDMMLEAAKSGQANQAINSVWGV